MTWGAAAAAAGGVIAEVEDNESDEDRALLEDVDEVSTKLDLARAYIDMGDVEGAKEILEEVAEEGDEGQRAEAGELLGSLD